MARRIKYFQSASVPSPSLPGKRAMAPKKPVDDGRYLCEACQCRYDPTAKFCPDCGAPNESLTVPHCARTEIVLDLDIWRSVCSLACRREVQPNRIIMDAVERYLTEELRKKK